MRLPDHPLIVALLALDLPADDYVVAGSAPMLLHGLRTDIADLDVLARGAAWERAVTLGDPQPAPSGRGEAVRLLDGHIEITNRWISPQWDVDTLIDRADVVDGVRFARLSDVLSWKRFADRPKDQEDIAILERHLRPAP